MRIRAIRTIPGPNVFAYKPVLVMTLDLEGLADVWSSDIEGFGPRLSAWLPGLAAHTCSRGYPGGFLERLAEGTGVAHVVEHVALELSELAAIPVNFGRTVSKVPGRYDLFEVAVAYVSEAGMRVLLRLAVEGVQAAAEGRDFDFRAGLGEAREAVADTALGPSTRAIVEAAAARSIPWRRLNDLGLVQLGYGRNRRIIDAAVTERTSAVALETVGDKSLTKALLAEAFLPVPRGEAVRTADQAAAALAWIGPPVAVKPEGGNHGRGVSLDLWTADQVRAAFDLAQAHDPSVLVEELFHGRDYRVLVVGGKLAAAAERSPAAVVGDGLHSVRELVDLANLDPRRGEGHDLPLTRLVLDRAAEAQIARQGLAPDSVPEPGREVRLRANANISTGGTARDVTDRVHPEVRAACERAARIIGLDICGVDLVVPDIDRPMGRCGIKCGIIELNAGPGLRMHLAPSEGSPRDAGGAIVDMLYPPGTPARIPIAAVTGTNGKTTVARLAAHILQGAGLRVGHTSTDGIQLDGEFQAWGDMTGPQSARAILSDPAVEAAVLEVARGGIVRSGLGYDWSDVGVVTNIQEDHFGQDGIESIEDLVRIKSLVAERVREGGVVVLNADDPASASLAGLDRVRRIPREIVYVTVEPDNPLAAAHLAGGGTAFRVAGDMLVESSGAADHPIVPAAALPAALGGAARFQLANALCAAAACRALGVDRAAVAAGLASFRSELHNPGRVNLYRVGRGRLLVDYGHNPRAFEEIGRLRSALANGGNGHGRFLGVVAVPGDRSDDLVRTAGRAVARGFDAVIVREDEDLRGRPAGEVARLLAEEIRAAAPDLPLRVVPDQREALRLALREVAAGATAVYFLDKRDVVDEVLAEVRARPLDRDGPAAVLGPEARED